MSKRKKPAASSTKRTGSGDHSLPVLPRWLIFTSAAALLVLFAGLTLWEMSGDAPTSDERIHLPVGYAYWKAKEFRLNPEHPPLVKLLCSAPLLLMDLKMPSIDPDSIAMSYPRGDKLPEEYYKYNAFQQGFGSQFLFTQDADRILFWGRLPVVGLGLLLCWFVFRWSWQLHGHPGAGLLSLFLVALEPSVLAHSHYVTTDVALACFSVMAMFFLWKFSREGQLRHFVLASLGLALALASKFSGVFLAPVFFFLAFVMWPKGGVRSGGLLFTGESVKARLVAFAAATVGIAVVVQASYLFSPNLGLYYRGLRSVNINHIEGFPSYVHGRFFPGGVWWYSLYALLVKTPIPTLLIIGAAVGGLLGRREGRNREVLFALLPAAVYAVAVCAFADNLGVRYMIPVTVFLLVLAGRLFFSLAGSRGGKISGAVLALWLALSVLRGSPYHIAYFNELVGGAENGPYFLNDSNIDWGQDLKRLVQYMQEQGVREPILSYWGPGPPEYYEECCGVTFKPWTRAMAASAQPPPGVYAISVNNLVALEQPGQDNPNLDWLRRFQPADRIGYSIYIYRFPKN